MGGNAPAGGFNFQSDAFAFIAAHALALQPLDWFDSSSTVPVAISMEAGGPGDDVGVELSDGRAIELQAKKGLSRGSEFDDAITRLARGLAGNPRLLGVLLVDPAASFPIRETLRQDFLRLGDGRSDSLKRETGELLAKLDAAGIRDRSIFRRLRIVAKDFAPSGDARVAAISLLRGVLSEAEKASDAWSILSKEGLALCARKGRRTTEALGLLLRLRQDVELRVLARLHYCRWVEAANADFLVPAFDVRLPIKEAWNKLRWLEPEKPSRDPRENSLAQELERYHEWARLADDTRAAKHRPVADFLDGQSRLVIIGGPGSGKSTLLRSIAHDAAAQGKTVLRVSLQRVRQFMASGRRFEEAVAAAASQGSPLDEHALSPLLADADLLLADGLDEAEPQRLDVAGALSDWALSHPQTRVCVTTRPVGHQPSLLRTFHEAEILPLSRHASGDLAMLLLRAAGYSPGDAQRLAEPFSHQPSSREENPGAAGIAMRNPLLLTFLVRLHADGQGLDGQRATLYRRTVDLIRRTPPADREGVDDLEATLAHFGLRALAWKLRSAPGCTREEALSFLAGELSAELGTPRLACARQGEEIERFWENRRLLERVRFGSEEALTFIHLSLAEFAAAEYLCSMPDPVLARWLTDHRRNDAWHDTIALAAGAGALERMVPLLLEMDQPDDPCSNEITLAAAAIMEAEHAPADLAWEVIRRLAQRLDSPIPLLSIEAAQRLVSAAPAMRELVERVCRPRLSHPQSWTRLGAHAGLLALGPAALTADQVIAWLNDPEQKVGVSSRRTENIIELPDIARSLRCDALTHAFAAIFHQLTRDEARRAADRFLGDKLISFGEVRAVGEVLETYESSDLIDARRWGGKPRPGLLDLNLNFAAAIAGFLRLLLDAVGGSEAPARDYSRRRMPRLLAILALLDWWEQPFHAIAAFAYNDGQDTAVEVLRAVVEVAETTKTELAAELNHLLSLEDANAAISEVADTTVRAPSTLWSRGVGLAVDVPKLILGFVHPSALIRLATAQLVYAGTGGTQAADELKLLLPLTINEALHLVAVVGAKVWGADAPALLIRRFQAEPVQGTEHICAVLVDHVDHFDNKPAVSQLLLGALRHPRPAVAAAAAQGIWKLRLDPTAQHVALLEYAFTYWRDRDLLCESCRVLCTSGTCPQCHVIPNLPLEHLVRELARVGRFKPADLLELSQNPAHQISDPAIDELVEAILADATLLATLDEQWVYGGVPLTILDKLLGLPGHRLAPLAGALLVLRGSSSAKVRARIVAALPALSCDPATLEASARHALTDSYPEVRNAGVQAVRLLRSKGRPANAAPDETSRNLEHPLLVRRVVNVDLRNS